MPGAIDVAASPDAHSGARRSVPVRLEGLRRRFGSVQALDGLDLDLAAGEVVALLGPSGCGKTTALRVLAGLEDADSARVLVDGRDITDVPANRRDMGMVFQAYSLFPHLTAQESVEFGLLRGRYTGERRPRRPPCSSWWGSPRTPLGIRTSSPAASSSGWRSPARSRSGHRCCCSMSHCRRWTPRCGFSCAMRSAASRSRSAPPRCSSRTTRREALAIADRVGVMRDGRLEQVGPPAEIYLRPANAFVADFVGLSNRLPGRVSTGTVEVLGTRLPLIEPESTPDSTAPVTALVRPESIDVVADSDGSGRVLAASFLGPTSRVTIALPGDTLVVAQVASARLTELPAGTAVRVDLHPVPVALAT